MKERDDCHAPSRLVPDDYCFIAQEYFGHDLGAAMMNQAARETIRNHMTSTGGNYSRHQHGGNCMVCGNVNALYTILFYHAKTNTYVRMGQECAELVDRQASEGLNFLRKQVKDAREYEKGKKKAQALLADAGCSAAWPIYTGEFVDKFEERTIRDIVGKLVQYGSISDKAMGFVRDLLAKLPNRDQIDAELAAKRAAQREAASLCPTGRVKIKGVILSVRVEEIGAYSFRHSGPATITKMLVQDDSGFKVWGTMPAGTHGKKGERIEFKATVTPSEKDNKFGFAKRPKLIEAGNDKMKKIREHCFRDDVATVEGGAA